MSKRTWTPLRVCLWQSFGGRKKYWQDVRALPLLKSFQTEKNLIPPAWQAPLSVIISQPHVVLETIMVGLQGREKSLMTLSLSVSIQYRRVTERSIARVKKKRKQYIRLHTITHTWKHMIATLGSNMYSLWISSTLLWRRQGEANRVNGNMQKKTAGKWQRYSVWKWHVGLYDTLCLSASAFMANKCVH